MIKINERIAINNKQKISSKHNSPNENVNVRKQCNYLVIR